MMPPAGYRRTPALLLVLLLLTLAAGCRQVLYSQLSEHDANEMLAALAHAGIEAHKTTNEKYWGVEVERARLAAAVQVLAREGLPRSRYASMAELFKRESIVSTPTEERVRFIYGVSQELAKTLSLIDGVVAARVHIVMPQNDPLADRAKPSSASVFIRHRPDADLQRDLTAIRSLVVRSVEGLTHDTVFVSLFTNEQAAGAHVLSAKQAGESQRHDLLGVGQWGSGTIAAILAVLAALLVGVLVFVVFQPLRARHIQRWLVQSFRSLRRPISSGSG